MESLPQQKYSKDYREQIVLTVSIIIVTHSEERLRKLKRILNSLAAQTYPHLEIIVVGNGVTASEHDYLSRWADAASNRRFIPFDTNVWNYDDHSAIGRLRYQPGINLAQGELIFCQSDDDFVAPDFFERMVNLFVENPECMTTIGLPLSYYWASDRVVTPPDGAWKNRPRYMHGKDLVLNWIKDGSFHPNPGFCFVTRKELFLASGDNIWYGYDTSVLLSLVPQGITGFDAAALMYWGRHDDQAHFELNRRHYKDFVYVNAFKARDRFAIDQWRKIGSQTELRALIAYLKSELAHHSVQGFFKALKEKKLRLAIKHLLLSGFSSRLLIRLKMEIWSMLRVSIKYVVFRIFSIKRLRIAVGRALIRYLKVSRFHHVRHFQDSGVDVTFIEYKHVAMPPDRELVDLASAAGRLLISEWEGQARYDKVPRSLHSLFDFGNHYLLLTALARARQATKVIEIGTAGGASLWSWLQAECVQKVSTWDINSLENSHGWLATEDCRQLVMETLSRESRRWKQFIEDLSDPEVWGLRFSQIVDADIIFVDGPHDGIFERKILSMIVSLQNPKDILLVFVGIRISSMVDFWYSLPLPKLDITFIGHQSGTGIALLKADRP